MSTARLAGNERLTGNGNKFWLSIKLRCFRKKRHEKMENVF